MTTVGTCYIPKRNTVKVMSHDFQRNPLRNLSPYRMNLIHQIQRRCGSIIPIVVLSIAALFALVIGIQLATSDSSGIAAWVFAGFALLYLVKLHQYSWQILLLLGFTGFVYYPIGFQITADHLSALLACFLGILSIAKTGKLTVRNSRGINILCLIIGAWVIFGTCHFVYSHLDPYIAREYSLKNALKSYFSAFAPPLILGFFLIRPVGITVKNDHRTQILLMLGFASIINLIYRIFMIRWGLADDEEYLGMSGFYIPLINAVPGQHIGRFLGSFSLLAGLAFVTDRNWVIDRPFLRRLLVGVVISIGVPLAALSGGRAVFVIAFSYIFTNYCLSPNVRVADRCAVCDDNCSCAGECV